MYGVFAYVYRKQPIFILKCETYATAFNLLNYRERTNVEKEDDQFPNSASYGYGQ